MLKFSDQNISEYQELINSGKPLILLASAEWCGPCKLLKPAFEKLVKEFESLDPKDPLAFGMLDTDFGMEITSSLAISAIPTILFIKDSIVKHRLIGVSSREKMIEAIKDLLKYE